MHRFGGLAALLFVTVFPSFASVMTYGTEDCLTLGCYGASDPTAGATQQGLAPNVITLATGIFAHSYPFSPTNGDFPGTDQIYVGSNQTGSDDGYSTTTQRIAGPALFTLDYSSLVAPGQTVTSLTLGIAADDFQFAAYGDPFFAMVNGVTDTALSNLLESTNLGGPVVQYLTIGLDPSIDTASHVLTLSIDEGGDGGDGYAVDFLTIGVTTTASSVTPEPSSAALMFTGLLLVLGPLASRARRGIAANEAARPARSRS